MRSHVANMDTSMYSMQRDMRSMSSKLETLPPLLREVSEMNQSMKYMTVNTGQMSYDMRDLNNTMGPPMSIMNSFTPGKGLTDDVKFLKNIAEKVRKQDRDSVDSIP